MKKIFLTTAFITLALSSQAYAVDMDYNGDTRTGQDINNPDASPGTRSTTKHHRHHKKIKTSTSGLATHSINANDRATSRQGLPSGETNGPITNQSDNQNYGQPTNH